MKNIFFIHIFQGMESIILFYFIFSVWISLKILGENDCLFSFHCLVILGIKIKNKNIDNPLFDNTKKIYYLLLFFTYFLEFWT